MLLATLGVVIAVLVGGVLLWEFTGLPFYISFLFAAVIAPTDAATVLELFRRLNVPPKLSALVDTEAAFNDATGIIIFTIILGSIASSGLPLLTGQSQFHPSLRWRNRGRSPSLTGRRITYGSIFRSPNRNYSYNYSCLRLLRSSDNHRGFRFDRSFCCWSLLRKSNNQDRYQTL